MFKLVVLSALVAVAAAKPSLYHGAVEVAAPIVAKTYLAPAAVSSTYREDIISKPAAVAYAAAPAYSYAAPVVAKTIVAEPISVAAPIVAKTVVAPAAVSHTYREDIISKPAAVAYAAPAVAISAPLVQKTVAYAAPTVAVAAPVVQKAVAYSAPVAYAAPAAISSSYRTDVVSSPVVTKTIVAPAAYTYAAHAPAALAYGAHAPAAHAW